MVLQLAEEAVIIVLQLAQVIAAVTEEAVIMVLRPAQVIAAAIVKAAMMVLQLAAVGTTVAESKKMEKKK